MSGRDDILDDRLAGLARSLVSNASVGIVRTDNSGCIVVCNDGFARLLGYDTPEELAGAHLPSRFYRNQADRDMLASRCRRDGSVEGADVEWVRRDGTTVYVRITAWWVRGATPSQDCFESLVLDVTRAVWAERKVRESELRYRSVVDASREVVFQVGSDGRWSFLNRAWEAVSGYAVAESLGRRALRFVHPEDRRKVAEEVRRMLLRPGYRCEREIRFQNREGQTRWCEWRAQALVDGDGRAGSVCGVVRDVTEWRDLQSQLGQVRKLESIGHLAAGIAHEINTPAQYVTDNLAFVLENLPRIWGVLDLQSRLVQAAEANEVCGPQARAAKQAAVEADLDFLKSELPAALAQSQEGVSRISDIVRAMKEFSHPGSAESVPSDLGAAVRNTLVVSRNEWKYVADARTDLDPDLPPVPCHVAEFNQLLLNLVVNAAHAIEDRADRDGAKGTITVSTRLDGEWAEVRVADTGTGIPEGIRDQIFDPFFTTKPPGRGSGQGLTLAHRVVQKHGGTLTFETKLNEGTTFVVRLPLGGGEGNREAA